MTPYYSDDLVTIYHGDSRGRVFADDFDVLVTDPPYGVSWRSEGGGMRSRSRKRRGVEALPVFGDDEPFDPAPWLDLNLPTVLFGANHYASRLPDSPTWLVWDKRPNMASNDQADCELIWTNLGGPARVFRLTWNGGIRPTADRRAPKAWGVLHPTQKPVSLMRWVLGLCPEGIVVDPYMGSGTTLLAGKSLGRTVVGFEIEERYCEIAAQRCSQEVLGLTS